MRNLYEEKEERNFLSLGLTLMGFAFGTTTALYTNNGFVLVSLTAIAAFLGVISLILYLKAKWKGQDIDTRPYGGVYGETARPIRCPYNE